MTDPRIDLHRQVVHFGESGFATVSTPQPGPPQPAPGLNLGVAKMTQSAPHGGEMHPDGDELLFLIRGRVRVRLETDPVEVVELGAGDALVVPRGVWHRVEVLEPCEALFATPGPGFEFRPPADAPGA